MENKPEGGNGRYFLDGLPQGISVKVDDEA
jgi:hypothetical protein